MSFTCKAQDNTINYNELTINDINFLGNNVSLVIQHLGQPNTIEEYYFEMQDVMSQKYKYNDIIFTVINNRTYSFEIIGSNYTFTSNNINVGDNINKLQPIYPLSFTSKSSDALSLDFVDMDRFIIISFNSINNIIDKIETYSY
ncbi:hypothetical protein [Lutibacter profundi]|uniref:hypothetical protein n=1 Tax=Lutibacter profundi TaxID=1622118 RepID=UPI0011873625|nr:hypothetical protein [Lutibacter profundi]